jgi:serine/threonine-protein kinase
MPPEQIRGERIDERADIYALGVLMYQLLTGSAPFHAEHPRQIALLHLQAPAPRPSAVAPIPPALDEVVLRCLEKKPERRYQSMAALRTAFGEAVGQATEPRAETSWAVAFYLEASVQSDDDGGLDDAVLDDLLDVLELAQQTLLAHDFVFPLYTSNALLAVRPLPGGSDHDRALVEARALAAELTDQLARRGRAHVDVHPQLSMTLGEVVVRTSDAGVEITGGPLFDLDTWTALCRV